MAYDNPVVRYGAKVVCLNYMSVSARTWCDYITIQNEVSMADTNVKNVYKGEWYDSVSMNQIDCASVVKEMIGVTDRWGKCEIFNIDVGEFIINSLCIN